MTLRAAWQAWDRFWFKPVPPDSIALFRILFGLLVLVYAALLAPDWEVWFGRRGILSVETSFSWSGGPGEIRLLDWLPAGAGWHRAFFAVFTAAAACLTLGLFTRASAIAVFLGLISLHNRNTLILNSGDALMRTASFYLIFCPAGAAYSLDRWRRLRAGLEPPGPPPESAPVGQRLIQIQLAVMYLSSVMLKLQGSSWVDGTAVYYTSRLQEFWRFPVPYLFEHLWTIKLLTWGTLALELAIPLLIWFKRTRYPVLIAGALFHLMLEYTMSIPLFQSIVLAYYVTFIDLREIRRQNFYPRYTGNHA